MRKWVFAVAVLVLTIYFGYGSLLYHLKSELYFYLNPDIDTVYAEGFSWRSLNEVKKGMSVDEVERLLGKPLDYVDLGGFGGECYEYSTDGKCGRWCDFAWISARVCFDEEMKVNGVYKNVFYD